MIGEMCTLYINTIYIYIYIVMLYIFYNNSVYTVYRHCMCTLYIVTLYACITVTLCMLYNFSKISDTVLTLHGDTVYGEHSVTIQCVTVSVLYIASL